MHIQNSFPFCLFLISQHSSCCGQLLSLRPGSLTALPPGKGLVLCILLCVKMLLLWVSCYRAVGTDYLNNWRPASGTNLGHKRKLIIFVVTNEILMVKDAQTNTFVVKRFYNLVPPSPMKKIYIKHFYCLAHSKCSINGSPPIFSINVHLK